MQIPTEVRKPKSINPVIMLIYAAPKQGKTTICSHLENHLFLECEPNGANFVEGRVMDINAPKELNEALSLIETSPTKVCDYLIIDTVTKLDEWSEIVGTYHYMDKSQGKKWNRELDANGNPDPKKKILHTDNRFESVHELGQGYGFAHSRNVMVEWYDRILNLTTTGKVSHVIFISHIKDKYIETKSGDIVESNDINLTGKVKSIFTARVDAVAMLKRKDNKAYLMFNNEYKTICGGRCTHLEGEILISEKKDGNIITYWDSIYKKQ